MTSSEPRRLCCPVRYNRQMLTRRKLKRQNAHPAQNARQLSVGKTRRRRQKWALPLSCIGEDRIYRHKEARKGGLQNRIYSTMKTILTFVIAAGLVSTAAGQPFETAKDVAKTTAEKTKEAAETVAHGAKK